MKHNQMQKKLKNKIKNNFIEDKRGFGIEDAPFQILAAVVILVVTAGIGMHLWGNFNCGNQCHEAAETALDIHKYSKLLSAGSVGSQKIIHCRLPQGFEITFSNGNFTLDGTGNKCDCITTKELGVEGVNIDGSGIGDTLDSGYHKLKLVFEIDSNGDPKVKITKLN